MSCGQVIGNVDTDNDARAFVGSAGGNVFLGDIHGDVEVHSKKDPRGTLP
jgi:hypothetical protein